MNGGPLSTHPSSPITLHRSPITKAGNYAGLEEDLRGHGARCGVARQSRRQPRGPASSEGRCELRVEHPTRVLLAATRRKVCGRAAVNAPGHPDATRSPASSAGRRRPHSGRVLHPEFAATRKKVAWTSVQTPRRLWTEVQAALRRTAVFALPKRGGSPAGCRLRRAGSPRSPSANRG